MIVCVTVVELVTNTSVVLIKNSNVRQFFSCWHLTFLYFNEYIMLLQGLQDLSYIELHKCLARYIQYAREVQSNHSIIIHSIFNHQVHPGSMTYYISSTVVITV